MMLSPGARFAKPGGESTSCVPCRDAGGWSFDGRTDKCAFPGRGYAVTEEGIRTRTSSANTVQDSPEHICSFIVKGMDDPHGTRIIRCRSFASGCQG